MLTAPDSSAAARRGARQTLVRVLEALLRLTHPLMPFITEEIWQRVAPLAGVAGDTIMQQPYPRPADRQLDPAAEAEMNWVQAFLSGIRRIRAEMDIPPGRRLPVLLQHGGAEDRARLERNRTYLHTLGRLESIVWLADDDPAPEAAIALAGELKILIPMAGLIDQAAELARLNREIDRLRKDLERGLTKLSNPDFLGRAPAEVVAKERARVAGMQNALAKLDAQLATIQRL